MADNKISDYYITFESTEKPLFNYTDEPTRIYKQIHLEDSMFDFFPYAEVIIDDSIGSIYDGAGYIYECCRWC